MARKPAFTDGQIIKSTVSGTRYQVGGALGEGGFGQVFRAAELNRYRQVVDDVCLKATLDATSWHRESYFGHLLQENRRVIQLMDSFPLQANNSKKMYFCLVFELAVHGTVESYLEETGKRWTGERVKREISALLKVLDQLHGGSATHRDLTPGNIFVCANGRLKLGDFGIAAHSLAGKPGAVEAFNPGFVTRGFQNMQHRHWLTADDVFQMGQLMAMLLYGDASELLDKRAVSKLDCDSALKDVIKKAIGPRHQRFADAYEMLEAIEGKAGPKSKLRSIKGKTLVFTGPLSIRRFDAEVLVLQAGGNVTKSITKDVDIIVQGGRSPHYKSAHKGTKLKEAERLIKKGHKIEIIGEAEFRRLVRKKKSA